MRSAFIETLNEQLGCFRCTVFIVFDSAHQMSPYAQCAQCEHLDVLYAPKGRTADQYILELIEISRSPKSLTVVTSDTGLARQCHYLGAKTLSIEQFMELIVKKGKKGICRPPCYQETPAEIERLLKIFEKRLSCTED